MSCLPWPPCGLHLFVFSFVTFTFTFKADCYEKDKHYTVVLREAEPEPPIRVENYSRARIQLRQSETQFNFLLRPNEYMNFAMDDPSPNARQELEITVLDALDQAAIAHVPVLTDAPKCIKYKNEQHQETRLYIQPIPDHKTGTICYIIAPSLSDIRQV